MGERAGSAGSGVAAAAGDVRSGRVGVGAEPPPPALAAELAAVEVLAGLPAARPPGAGVLPVAVVPTPALVPPWAAGSASGVAVDVAGSIALAGAERAVERMLEPWEPPPRASAIEVDATSNTAMAEASCNLDVSMLTPLEAHAHHIECAGAGSAPGTETTGRGFSADHKLASHD